MVEPAFTNFTFLFTDIEGSTRLWELHPTAMVEALERHDIILHSVIEDFKGVVVKATGDGMLAVFRNAVEGLLSAIEIQKRLIEQAWSETGPLLVRCALHSGTAEQRGMDFFGPTVNRTARLLSCIHGGQITISQAVFDQVDERLPVDIQLKDLGIHRLKDLSRPERVFQVIAPGLPVEFPPLTSLDYRPNNLPAQVTPFIGRVQELTEVTNLLKNPDTRLVTLSGPGGTGKTRLGLQVAAEVLDEFQHGVFFVNLAPARDKESVTSTLSHVLGIHESVRMNPLEGIIDALRDQQLLLFMDNFEQVIPSALIVGELLQACPKIKFLVTSRELLHLRGEHDYPVPPLQLPDPDELRTRQKSPLQVFSECEAVALFVQRAQAARHDFRLTDENAQLIAEICVRLDGLPLAIELSAARIKLFSLHAIRSRLDRSLDFLTGGARDLPSRHQTLRATIAWSYELLDIDEQKLFRRLSVFLGSASFEAIEAICNHQNELEGDIFELVESLVDKSLLKQVEMTDQEIRFYMLDTIREFAHDALDESGEGLVVRLQRAAYYLAFLEQAEPRLSGVEQADLLDQIEEEHDNIRAVLRRAKRHDEGEIGLRVTASLWRFWYTRGYFSEGRTWIETFVNMPLPEESSISRNARAKSFNALGVLCQHQGDFELATHAYERALKLRRELGDQSGVAGTLCNLGFTTGQLGNYPKARLLLEESYALYRQLNHLQGMSIALNNLGEINRRERDYVKARQFYEESLKLKRSLENPRGIAITLNNLGEVTRLQGDHELARNYLNESLDIFRELGDKWGMAGSLSALAEVALAENNYAVACQDYRESLNLRLEIGDKEGVAFSIEGMAGLACAESKAERAVQLFGFAEALRTAISAPLPPVDRDDYETRCSRIRSQLGSTLFDKLRQSGRNLSLEEAVAVALEEDS